MGVQRVHFRSLGFLCFGSADIGDWADEVVRSSARCMNQSHEIFANVAGWSVSRSLRLMTSLDVPRFPQCVSLGGAGMGKWWVVLFCFVCCCRFP